MRTLCDHSLNDDATLRDVVHLLHSNAFNGMIISIAAISALTFGFDTPETDTLKLNFWFVMVAVLVLRFADAVFWMKILRKKALSPRPAYFRFGAGVILTASLWGGYSVAFFHQMAILELATTMVVLSALAGGAATVLGASRALAWIYCILLLIPMSLMAMLDTRNELFILGILGIAFCITMLGTSRRTNTFFLETIELKEQNQTLMEQMSEERNEVVRVNKALSLSNHKLDAINTSLEAEVQSRTDDIVRLSNLDPLTSLMNRAGFLRHLRKEIKRVSDCDDKLAVLFVDLDGFKQVNDSLGHLIGDKVLMAVAARLSRFTSAECLSRWGGDEFIVLSAYSEPQQLLTLASDIRDSIAQGMTIDNNQINLDATIGISIYPDHGIEEQQLIQRADITMYHEKRSKRSHIGIFNDAVYNAVYREMSLREGLRKAIRQGEFHLVYQPLICAASGKAWSFEVLLRWRFKGQEVSPDEFIPIAERSGDIHSIGMWVLSQACQSAARWRNEDIAISVNVSVIQLMEDTFVDKLDIALARAGLAPERLHLEVTESVFADNKEKLAAQVNAINARHIGISIDDFGTGFSSLSQLQLLHFDYIKIDRSFIKNLESCGEPIIRATLMIAGEFGCKTIAEGVETEQQATRLKAMGVDYLQGYYFARPEGEEDIARWFYSEQ